jgi:hypothetical protein
VYEIELGDFQKFGVIRDQEGHVLPPEAFTLADNMRSSDDGLEKVGGQEQIFGTPGVAPHFTMPVTTASAIFWLYTSLTKAYVYDGTSHTNITRQTAAVDVNYTTSDSRQWNGCFIGGLPILNNGVDPPQLWGTLSAATKLVALTNWPASTTALVLRAFGPYLFALNLTESAVNNAHVVRWSHPADPGAVPASWDFTDPTLDAGRVELTDVDAGIIQDGLVLGSNLFIYKEGATHRVTLIGGNDIFDFKPFLTTSGILTQRCVALMPDGQRHFVATKDDIIVHDGNRAESVIEEKYRRYLFNTLDPVAFKNAFVFSNARSSEMIFCYPESGNTNPNKALIWNYRRNVMTEKDVNYRWAASGPIETGTGETWDTGTSTWETSDGAWSTLLRRRVILCGTDATKFFDMDAGSTRDGVAFTGTLQRVGIALAGRKRNGDWIVDWSKRKQLNRVWIRATGGSINVRIGFQEQENGGVSWSAAKVFDPAADHFVDHFGSGRAVSIEFSSESHFKILSYKLEGDVIGSGM